jgi:hypothetical protein
VVILIGIAGISIFIGSQTTEPEMAGRERPGPKKVAQNSRQDPKGRVRMAGGKAKEAARDAEWAEWQREVRDLEAMAREWEKAEQKRLKAEEDIRLAPIRAENAAASKLKLAKMLIADDPDNERLKERAVFRLEELVKKYPETKAAAEAKKLLKELSAAK